jgi:hypothetical protein
VTAKDLAFGLETASRVLPPQSAQQITLALHLHGGIRRRLPIDVVRTGNTQPARREHQYRYSRVHSTTWSIIMIKLKTSRKFLSTLAGIAAVVAGGAHADGWPTTVAGSWTIVANQMQSTLVLTQASGGAGSECQPIYGTAFADTVHGFYCPGSGRISFRRGLADQTYIGNLSQTGTTNRMGGTWESLGGEFGEYDFYATSNPAAE